jgi:hypothetical protein
LEAILVDPVKACAKETGGAAAVGSVAALRAVGNGAGRDNSACQSNMAAELARKDRSVKVEVKELTIRFKGMENVNQPL